MEGQKACALPTRCIVIKTTLSVEKLYPDALRRRYPNSRSAAALLQMQFLRRERRILCAPELFAEHGGDRLRRGNEAKLFLARQALDERLQTQRLRPRLRPPRRLERGDGVAACLARTGRRLLYVRMHPAAEIRSRPGIEASIPAAHDIDEIHLKLPPARKAHWRCARTREYPASRRGRTAQGRSRSEARKALPWKAPRSRRKAR